ncbi:hypothetical protein CCHR01_11192 [Colletotrichum chrysophilum]|uniref:Uncharacterized protein n=1 Tax=Colletotrichum chrysophilum TaxID=1836956 RepID=A0AAD9AFV7_9PEZI|nr:hypothetical protein CCHR01_11192 [Colletotrichum chrysophilum]
MRTQFQLVIRGPALANLTPLMFQEPLRAWRVLALPSRPMTDKSLLSTDRPNCCRIGSSKPKAAALSRSREMALAKGERQAKSSIMVVSSPVSLERTA